MKPLSAAIALCLYLAVGSTAAWAGLAAEPAAVDLGRCQQEQTLAIQVKLTNNGTGPVDIRSVAGDCSCTAAAPGKQTLAAGESTALEIKVETRGYIGRLRRTIRVQTSDGDLTIPIDMNVTLFKNWTLEPATVVVPPSPKGQEASVRVVLQHVGATTPERLGAISCTPDWLRAESAAPEGKNFSLNFVKPADAPAGNYTVKVEVATNDPAEPRIAFNVFVPITSSLRVIPNPVVFPTVKAGQTAVREITIQGWTSSGTPQLVLTKGEARLLGHEDGKFRYELTVTPGAPGPFTQLLRIYDGEKLEAELPLIARSEPDDKAK